MSKETFLRSILASQPYRRGAREGSTDDRQCQQENLQNRHLVGKVWSTTVACRGEKAIFICKTESGSGKRKRHAMNQFRGHMV